MFESGDYPGPAILAVALATVVALGARRLGAGSFTTLLVSMIVLGWYLLLIFQARRTLSGLPTTDALAALWRSLQRAWEQSRVDFAPVPVRAGYEVMVVGAMFVSAAVGELATFRWRRPVLAVIFPIVLFSVSLVVGTGAAAPLLTLLFLGSLLTYWAVESAHRMRSWGRWVSAWSHHKSSEPASLSGGLARRLGITCLAAAMVSPLFLPALGDGLVSWRSGLGGGGLGEGGSGEGGDGVDPWVSIRPSLVNQSPEVLFEVEADEASYWRVATLERFDGENWHEEATARVQAQDGEIDGPAPPLTHSEELSYELVSTGLGGDALPTAPTATEVRTDDHPDESLRYDPDSGNVFVQGNISEDDVFRIASTVTSIRYQQLRRAEPGAPGDVPPMYLQTPAPIDPQVEAMVERWTADAETPYERLVAIQTELRAYSYTLAPESPRGDDYLTDFLLRTQAGYCQQFATAFALLARYQNLPSRVSVGFLPGDKDIGADRYLVAGADAHAWPEVYFPDFGWIAFEPTPRGGFGAVPPAYTSAPIEGGLTGIDNNNAFHATGQEGNGPQPQEDPGGGEQIDAGGGLRGQERRTGRGPAATQAWEKTFGNLITALVLMLGAAIVIIPLMKELRIRRRYARADDPDAVAASAFLHFEEEAAELAVPRHPSESARAYAERMRTSGALADLSAARLAEIYELAAFGALDITEKQAAEAKRLAHRLRGQLWSGARWPARALRLFSPKRLRPSRP